MNKLSWGSLAIIIGSALLSIELYGINLVSEIVSIRSDGLLKYNDSIKYSTRVMIALIVYGLALVMIHFIQEYKKH